MLRVRFISLLLFTLPLFAAQLHASDKPIDVTVYFSYEDAHWTESQKIIDAVGEKYPRLQIHKINVDTPEGYKALHTAEERNNVKEFGELTIVAGGIVLTSKGDKRTAETAF